MNILGCLDVPTGGKYYLNGSDVSCLSDNELSDIRNRQIGFVFQGFNLIHNLDAIGNVELPLIYRGMDRRSRREAARRALELVGLEERLRHKPSEMSGGQQQRVAVARAIAAQSSADPGGRTYWEPGFPNLRGDHGDFEGLAPSWPNGSDHHP